MAPKNEKYDPLPDSFWFAPAHNSALTYSNEGTYPVAEVGPGMVCTFGLRLPNDFASITWARLVMLPDATETVSASFFISADAAGDIRATNLSMSLGETLAVTALELTEWEIGPFFPTLAAGDYVGVMVSSNVDKLRVVGLAVRYS